MKYFILAWSCDSIHYNAHVYIDRISENRVNSACLIFDFVTPKGLKIISSDREEREKSDKKLEKRLTFFEYLRVYRLLSLSRENDNNNNNA